MTRICFPRLLWALILAVPAAGPPGLHAQPSEETPLEVSFEEQAVVVSGLAPGSRVAWLSLASEPHRYFVREVRREGIEAADGTGTARIDAGEGVPPRSVWGVVDLESGAVAWAAPEGFALEEVVPEGDGLARGDGGGLNRLLIRAVGLELLVARPGSGAWGLTVFDGSPADRDGEPDGGLVAALDEGRPLLDSPAAAPALLLAGDVVLGIDIKTYRVFTLRSVAP